MHDSDNRLKDRPRGPHKNKRPLFFISGEDFYYLAYSILLVIELLGGSARRIKDHRKIAYLVQFLGDSRLVDILERTQKSKVKNAVDRDLLFSSYTNAELHKREVFKIIFSLERKGFLHILRTQNLEVLEVSLDSEKIPKNFFQDENFRAERDNSEKLKKLVPRLSMLTFDSLLERLYMDRGVRVWVS